MLKPGVFWKRLLYLNTRQLGQRYVHLFVMTLPHALQHDNTTKTKNDITLAAKLSNTVHSSRRKRFNHATLTPTWLGELVQHLNIYLKGENMCAT